MDETQKNNHEQVTQTQKKVFSIKEKKEETQRNGIYLAHYCCVAMVLYPVTGIILITC